MSLPGLRGATGLLQSKWLISIVSLATVCGMISQLSAQVINADGTVDELESQLIARLASED